MNARRLLYAALVLLLLLHQDFWNWYDAAKMVGLPTGFLHHVVFCGVVAVVMVLLLRFDRRAERD